MIWNVEQPLLTWPEVDGPTWTSQGDAESRYVARSLKRGWERGIWRIPHSLQSHPTLLQTQDCVRTSMSMPVSALYLCVPAPTHDLHEILIGLGSGTHDQLTKGATNEQTNRDSRATPGLQSIPSWAMEARRMTGIPGCRWLCEP